MKDTSAGAPAGITRRQLIGCGASALAWAGVQPAWALAGVGGSVSLLVPGGLAEADGARIAGLHIALEPGWKTYWREPGIVGIGPMIRADRSRNLKSLAVHFPAPIAFDEAGYRSIGYDRTVTLVLEARPKEEAGDIHLDLDIDYGVCSILCVPGAARLEGVLGTFSARNGDAARLVSAARAKVPVRRHDLVVSAKAEGEELTIRLNPQHRPQGGWEAIRLALAEVRGLVVDNAALPDADGLVRLAFTRTGSPVSETLRLTLVGEGFAFECEAGLDGGL